MVTEIEVVTHPELVTDPTYVDLWSFEKRTNQAEWADWFERNYYAPFLISIVYVASVLAIQWKMKNRSAIKAKSALIFWNAGLAIFSIVALYRYLPELIHLLSKSNGVHLSICSRGFRNSATVFWGILFVLSKVVELGDTVFIVLRKRSLTFLHVYHHVTVLLVSWTVARYADSSLFWFGTINVTVHSIMYTYFVVKCLGIHVNRFISMTITSLQLLQMVGGLIINLYILYVKKNGGICETQLSNVYLIFLLYATYCLLFSKYFYSTYVTTKVKNSHQKVN